MAKKSTTSKARKTSRLFPAKKRIGALRERHASYMQRRPHRSMRLTKRRDLPKHPPLPGYFAFSAYVLGTLWQHKKILLKFVAIYIFVSIAIIGVVTQANYIELRDALSQVGTQAGTVAQTFTLFLATASGGLGNTLTETQQVYIVLLNVFSWLVIIWILRQVLADRSIRLRDALYNAGAPIISLLLIGLFVVLQLFPAAIGALIYLGAEQSGLMDMGAFAMAIGLISFLFVVVSLYWITATFFATIIVTLPGTYPLSAIRAAGDMALGRRLSLMLRLLWVVGILVVIWALLLIPSILITRIIPDWIPIVPLVMQLLGSVSVVVFVTYVYLLYRKMIDET